MATVQVIKNHHQTAVTVQEGATLLQAIQTAGLSVSFPCGGRGRCGKCKVKAGDALVRLWDNEKRRQPGDPAQQADCAPEAIPQGGRP